MVFDTSLWQWTGYTSGPDGRSRRCWLLGGVGRGLQVTGGTPADVA
jgi:hypothetical protein